MASIILTNLFRLGIFGKLLVVVVAFFASSFTGCRREGGRKRGRRRGDKKVLHFWFGKEEKLCVKFFFARKVWISGHALMNFRFWHLSLSRGKQGVWTCILEENSSISLLIYASLLIDAVYDLSFASLI